jgi:aminopyrrolnitrin oxygenase
VTWDLLGQQVVIFRGMSGRVAALDAHCPHMGAHLAQGDVIGDQLRCAMHHWVIDPAGTCRGSGGGCLTQRVYPVTEQYGAVFVHADSSAAFSLPSMDTPGDRPLHVVIGKSELVEAAWPGIMANAFDTGHILAVHKRALLQPPGITQLGSHGIELQYASRITGRGLSDRAMKWLSGDRIHVTIRCWGGTLMTVRSQVGSRIGRLFVAVTPTARGAVVTPFVGVPGSRSGVLSGVSARLSLWLFTTFLRRDLLPLKNMDFRIEGALRSGGPVADLAAWLLNLPPARVG